MWSRDEGPAPGPDRTGSNFAGNDEERAPRAGIPRLPPRPTPDRAAVNREARTTQILYLEQPDRWVVVASNGGADWEPGWWLNLRAGMPGSVRIRDEVTPVTGTEVTGPEREELWRTLNEKVFDYTSYQRKVSRQIAVVALTPTSA